MVEIPMFGGPDGQKPVEDAFTKLLENFEAQELPTALHQSANLTPLRRQRKNCRPLRIPPTSGASSPIQANGQTCHIDGSISTEHQPSASLEVHTISETERGVKSKSPPPTVEVAPMGQFIQNGMKKDGPISTSHQEDSWVFRSLPPPVTRYDIRHLNNGVTPVSAGMSCPASAPQKERNSDCFSTTVCRNRACQAEISLDASFCRRCSCCICKLFDNKRDPSLWIVCDPNGGGGCGLSCHIECALKQRVAGVISNMDGTVPPLDGGYYCHSCRLITPLIGYWKHQLLIAKNAQTLDNLHYRLLLCYRLLKGTKFYEDAQCPVEEAIKRVGADAAHLTKGVKLQQCRVDALPCKVDVYQLINLALEKADTRILTSTRAANKQGLHNVKFMVCFEDVSSSSILVSVNAKGIMPKMKLAGYKLWHRRASEPMYAPTPTRILYNMDDKCVVSNLQPLTDYTFKVVPFSTEGDLAVCEAGCSTKGSEHVASPVDVYASLGVLFINTESLDAGSSRCITQPFRQEYNRDNGKNGPKIQDLDEILVEGNGHGYHMNRKFPASGKELNANHASLISPYNQGGTPMRCEQNDHLSSWNITAMHEGKNIHSFETLGSNQAQTGIGSVDMKMNSCDSADCLDEKFSRKCLKMATEQDLCPDSDRAYHAINLRHIHSSAQRTSTSKPFNQNPPQSWVVQDQPNGNAGTGNIKPDGGSVQRFGNCMQGVFTCNSEADFNDYEFSVKVIRWLECKGHLKEEFRMKFLTWFTLRASEQEKRVISVFIDTLQDDPASLAGQLVDSFEEMIGVDRRTNTVDSFCRRLW